MKNYEPIVFIVVGCNEGCNLSPMRGLTFEESIGGLKETASMVIPARFNSGT